jgi:hypothetical protein
LGGAGLAYGFRERDPLAVPAPHAKVQRPPRTDRFTTADPAEQFQRAMAEPKQVRAAALWSVIDDHTSDEPDAERAVLDAAVALLDLYVGQRDYSLLDELGNELKGSEKGQTSEMKTYGFLIRGIAAARRHETEESVRLFHGGLAGETRASVPHFQRERVATLARHFSLALGFLKPAIGDAKTKELEEQFTRRLIPELGRIRAGRPPQAAGD